MAGLEYGYCARIGEVDLRLIGDAETIARGRELAIGAFSRQLVSDDGASLEQVVLRNLEARGWKLAVAESCTGGLICSRLTDVAGASAVLTHGFVTYANEAKVEMLGVSEESLAEYGAVSETVAREMAEGALRVSGAQVAVAVTGIAGPGGGSEEKPVGTAWIGLAMEGVETIAVKIYQPRNRKDFKLAVSQAALDLVRRSVG
jgi:nicotinamide-nucleotide amidase